ncbi:MAG: SDR family oxidoreductase [Saprospiraceae bacterium]
MNLNLQGKNAFVGGSSKGIGKAIAIELATLGANVIVVSRTAEALAQVIHELPRVVEGQDHEFLVADYMDLEHLGTKVKGLASERPIHILVNNTGGPAGGPIVEASSEAFQKAFQKHVLCNQLLVQILSPGMIKENYGRIINVISTSVKAPLDNLGVSNTIRAAVANWAKTTANELGRYGITVNNILPGMTETERLWEIVANNAKKGNLDKDVVAERMKKEIPLGRFGKPEEIAAAAAFLASPAAAYITGTNITVDGGRTRSL